MSEQEQPKEELEGLREAIDAVDEAEVRQAIAKELVNLPDTFQVNGHKIELQHIPPRPLFSLNNALIEMRKCQIRIAEARGKVSGLELLESVQTEMHLMFEHGVDALYYLINPSPMDDEPKFTKDWIWDNLPITSSKVEDVPDGLGLQILKAYKQRMDGVDFFSVSLEVPVM